MAVKTEKTTEAKKALKIISVVDSAIDWDGSYPEESDLYEELSEPTAQLTDEFLPVMALPEAQKPLLERKKAHYDKHHDMSKLRFKTDDVPTLFVFAHPHRADVSRRMREIASGLYSDSQRGRKEKVESDIFTAVFTNFYRGIEEGFSGTLIPVQKLPNGRIPDDVIQGLEDADVFLELNNAFMRIYNEDKAKIKDQHKSEK